jgi:hypothetical protein
MRKQSKTNRKPREQRITLDMGQPVPVNGLMVDNRTGRVALLYNRKPVKPDKAVIESGYHRSKGFKPLVRAELSPGKLHKNPNRALEQFDLILAVDTNTKRTEDDTISVTSVVVARHSRVLVTGKTAIQFLAEQCVEFRNPTGKPETIGWQIVIEMLQVNPTFRPTMKVGIIVDSELDNLEDYNNRVLPISDRFYLPQNMTFVYASGDNATESVSNQLLSLADSIASRVLRQILEHPDEENLSVVDNRAYSHFRIWNRRNLTSGSPTNSVGASTEGVLRTS